MEVARQLVHGALLEWIGRVHVFCQVRLFELAVHDLVVLFQHFFESRLVELDEGPQLAQQHVYADDALLQRNALVVEGGKSHVVVVFKGYTRQAP